MRRQHAHQPDHFPRKTRSLHRFSISILFNSRKRRPYSSYPPEKPLNITFLELERQIEFYAMRLHSAIEMPLQVPSTSPVR